MKFVLFYHSLVSDWNHGNAHFLRGISMELLQRGHEVSIFEPANGWSLRNLQREPGGEAAIAQFHSEYPRLSSLQYDAATLDVERIVDSADVLIVHEWTDPALIARLGAAARARRVPALFHDTHHRAVSAPAELAALDLSGYSGVLAFGEVLRRIYLDRGFAARAWTWHEAADTRLFRPQPATQHSGDLVWIGNWGDGERAAELREFLVEPVHALQLRARVHGVRYPAAALAAMREAGIEYAGWLPNYRVPRVFAEFHCTVHVPRQAYARALPGIPTIRMFEALACGIPLVSAPWDDCEALFRPGVDHLRARDGQEMRLRLRELRDHADLRAELARNARATIEQRHSCAHRVDELLGILAQLAPEAREPLRRTGS
jgi:spore maturation protein CgeB